MRTVVIQPTFGSWRDAARDLLRHHVPPGDVLWSDATQGSLLFDTEPPVVAPVSGAGPRVPSEFLDLARSACAHNDPRRWAVLYRVLWRLTHGKESHLLHVATDPDLRQVRLWCKSVGREIHKMHAFVRFRLVGTNATTGREQFVAWFEPEYRIVRLAAPFFLKRFASMDWSILTPFECAHWDGASLVYTPGVARETAPDHDALDALWRTYYASIFNPARLKVRAMQSEMPKKYWKNLPEAPLIAGLVAESQKRVRQMLETEALPVKPAPHNPYLQSLHQRNRAQGDAPGTEGGLQDNPSS